MLENLQVLQIETTNKCNAKCSFCPHSKQTVYGDMSDELYRKILNEARDLPRLMAFIPVLTGEPFLDEKFVERVRMASIALPSTEIKFYTNGSFLNEDNLIALSKLSNIFMTVSLNAYTEDTRKAEMGLDDFTHVVSMIQTAFDLRIPLQTTMVNSPFISNNEKALFIDCGGQLVDYENWTGIQYEHERPNDMVPCRRALHHMPVTWDGYVPICCFDPMCVDSTRKIDSASYGMGDINEQTIQEVWESEIHQLLVKDHREGKANMWPQCKQCTHDVERDKDGKPDKYLHAQIQQIGNPGGQPNAE